MRWFEIYLIKQAAAPSYRQAVAAILKAQQSKLPELKQLSGRLSGLAERYASMTRARLRQPPGLAGVGQTWAQEEARSALHHNLADAVDALSAGWRTHLKRPAPYAGFLANPGRVSKQEASYLAEHLFQHGQGFDS